MKALGKFLQGKKRLRKNGITDLEYLKGKHTEEELDLFFYSRGEPGKMARSQR